jgi:serine/threonine protein kinase
MGEEFSFKIGDKFNNYKICSYLGGGHFGHTYKMEHPQLGFRVFKFATEDKNVNMLWKEVETQSKILNHPNIVRVYDIFTDAKIPFVIMEYVESGNLRQLMSTGATFNPGVAVDIAKQIASGLSYAHSKKVIHGDIKPENILLGSNNIIKITDFGLSRVITQSFKMSINDTSEYTVGTQQYMAPELGYGKSINEKSDIYSLGILISEMLGRIPGDYSPFSKVNSMVSEGLEEIINKCVCHENNRFDSANNFLDAIHNYEKLINPPQIKVINKPAFNFEMPYFLKNEQFLILAISTLLASGIMGGCYLNETRKEKRENKAKLIFEETPTFELMFDKMRRTGNGIYSTYFDVNKKFSKDKRILLMPEQDSYMLGMPVVSPDTNWIAYCRGDNGSLMIKPFAGGVATTLIPGQDFENKSIVYANPQWKDRDNIVVSRGVREVFDIKRKEPIMINIKTGKITPLKSN